MWLVSGALKNYYRVNSTLPDRIIVFRDGVGDGQLETVHEHEVRQLLECFKRVGEEYKYVTVTLCRCHFVLVSLSLCVGVTVALCHTALYEFLYSF